MSRPPKELASVLGRFQDELAPRGLLPAVQRHWRRAVGDEVAEEAWPDAERAGVVSVRCRSAVWAAELTMLADPLLGQLNEALPGDRQACALKFSAGPRAASRRRPAS